MFGMSDFMQAFGGFGQQQGYAPQNNFGQQMPPPENPAMMLPQEKVMALQQLQQQRQREEDQRMNGQFSMVLPNRGEVQGQQPGGNFTSPGVPIMGSAPASTQQGQGGMMPWNAFMSSMSSPNQGNMPNGSGWENYEPNLLLKLAEGYNRGGLVGALGMALTDF